MCPIDSTSGNAFWPSIQALGQTIVGVCNSGYFGSPLSSCNQNGTFGTWSSIASPCTGFSLKLKTKSKSKSKSKVQLKTQIQIQIQIQIKTQTIQPFSAQSYQMRETLHGLKACQMVKQFLGLVFQIILDLQPGSVHKMMLQQLGNQSQIPAKVFAFLTSFCLNLESNQTFFRNSCVLFEHHRGKCNLGYNSIRWKCYWNMCNQFLWKSSKNLYPTRFSRNLECNL